jgi:hypothetical protein
MIETYLERIDELRYYYSISDSDKKLLEKYLNDTLNLEAILDTYTLYKQ